MIRSTLRAALAALALARPPPRLRAGAARSPPIAYQSRTLANGLRVYAIRDTTSSNVSVQVWYDVGSKDDPRGRSGFAHLFEHMMFKATRNMVPEQFDRLTEDVGGFNNASTNDDYTNYYEVVPANHLQRLLWAEAERMGSLVDRAGLLQLRARRGEGGAAQPRPRRALWPALLSLSAADLLRRASLCAAGHRQHRGSRRRHDRRRARLPRHLLPARQCGAGRRRQFRSRPSSTAGSTNISGRSRGPPPPSRASPRSSPSSAEAAPLHGLRGQHAAARRADRLSRRRRRATPTRRRWRCSTASSRPARARASTRAWSIATASPPRPAPSSTSSRAAAASPSMRSSRGGQSAEAGEAALRREIARFRDAPVSAAELAEAKNELLTSALRGRETAEGRASAIAEAVIVDGDAARRRPPARRASPR